MSDNKQRKQRKRKTKIKMKSRLLNVSEVWDKNIIEYLDETNSTETISSWIRDAIKTKMISLGIPLTTLDENAEKKES